MIDLALIMPLRVLYDVSDEVWLAAASRSRSMKEAIEAVGVARYVTWLNLAKRHRADLVDQMKERLVTTQEHGALPRCSTPGCGRHVKARGLCKQEYEAWLAAASPETKLRRAVYPPDDQIVAWFQTDYSMTKVARRIGVARETLRDYIDHRPELAARVAPFKHLPRAVADSRNRAAWANWRKNNPEVVREINRRWAANQDPAKRRRWNTHNRLRRKAAYVPLTPDQVIEAQTYQTIVRNDPCAYCGEHSTTVDHIRPINFGGVDLWDNFVGACQRCNSQKNDKELLHYLLWRLENAADSLRGGDANPVDLPP